MVRTGQPIRISLVAPNGRMGNAIAAAVQDNPEFVIDNDKGDVLVDFSAPVALPASLDRALGASIPILVGTTSIEKSEYLAELLRRDGFAWEGDEGPIRGGWRAGARGGCCCGSTGCCWRSS